MDHYFEMPIKGVEKDKRASTRQIRITASRHDPTATKQFKKYPLVRANAASVFVK